MRKSNWAALIAVVVLIVIAFVAIRSLYYGTTASAYTPPEREMSSVGMEVAAVADRNIVEDSPTVGEGVTIVDYAHNNALFIEELNVLFAKLVERGHTYEIVTPELNEEEGSRLVDRLRYAESLIIPLPRQDFTAEEVAEIRRFVENGGRITIIGDPTRTIDVDALNSIAGTFGIIYADDYLYSLSNDRTDNNYRNVIYTEFGDSPLTEGLAEDARVVFYSGGSVKAPGQEIIMGDENVYSSTSEGRRTMASAVLTTDDQVLALGDLTFLGEPYNAVESNGQLINNIADFMTNGQRTYDLVDFPYFFNHEVDVVFDNTLVFNSQFEDSVEIKEVLENNDHQVSFTNEIGDENDVIFVGRFDETEPVQDYLDAANIVILDPVDEEEDEIAADGAALEVSREQESPTVADAEDNTEADQDFVEGRIQIAGVGQLERGGSTLFYRHQQDGRNILIILSDNPDTNADAFELLLDNELASCTLNSSIAVCQTEDPTGKLPPSIRSTRIDKILIVSDNDGRPREDKQTGFKEFQEDLKETYKVSTWVTSSQGSPDLLELQEYDAIVWATGDYWDDSIAGDDAEVLSKYIEAGGNLVLSGAAIAFDWDHTDFLENVVHADYLTFAEQDDIEVAIEEHPIARGFAMGDVITFTETPSGEPIEPDVVTHLAQSRVIFERGPDSQQSGAPTVIAYEDDRSKIAYFAFPMYLLPDEPRATIVGNTIDWFTRRPLDLPRERDYEPFESSDEAPADEEEDSSDEEGDGEEGNGDETENGEDGEDQENGEEENTEDTGDENGEENGEG